MQADENVRLHPSRLLHPYMQRHEVIGIAREVGAHGQPLVAQAQGGGIDAVTQALGNLQAFWILGFVATQFPVGWALDGFAIFGYYDADGSGDAADPILVAVLGTFSAGKSTFIAAVNPRRSANRPPSHAAGT